MRGLMPYLQVSRSADAIDWYCRVFRAHETRARLVAPDGAIMNAELEIEGTRIMISDAMETIGSLSPEGLPGTTVVLNLHVDDVDAVYRTAIEAGAMEVYPPADQFYGDRAGRLRDPFGHCWIIATSLRTLSDPELVSAFEALYT